MTSHKIYILNQNCLSFINRPIKCCVVLQQILAEQMKLLVQNYKRKQRHAVFSFQFIVYIVVFIVLYIASCFSSKTKPVYIYMY